MSTHSGDEVAGLVADIIRTLTVGVTVGEGESVDRGGTFHRESIDSAYRWLLNVERARTVAAGPCQLCGGSGWIVAAGEDGTVRAQRCEHGGSTVRDPTGRTVLDVDAVRAKLDQVAKHLEKALSEVHGAVSALQSGFLVHDSKVRASATTKRSERLWPRLVTQGEVKAARAAQGRRAAREEGHGDG